MTPSRHTEDAFETVIEAYLLQNGYVSVDRNGFDRERAIFPETVLAFIRDTQPAEWAKLEALHGEKTGAARRERARCRRGVARSSSTKLTARRAARRRQSSRRSSAARTCGKRRGGGRLSEQGAKRIGD